MENDKPSQEDVLLTSSGSRNTFVLIRTAGVLVDKEVSGDYTVEPFLTESSLCHHYHTQKKKKKHSDFSLPLST